MGCDHTLESSTCPPSTVLSVENALQIVLTIAQRLSPITIPLQDALGLVLAEDILALDPLPPYRASTKDGFAVVASDGLGEYPVITESRAGNDAVDVTVTPGTVAYVTTGGPIPDGADSVVQVEDTKQIEDAPGGLMRVRILKAAIEGQDIRPVGCDIEKGSVVLKTGELVGSSEMGLLATVGMTTVKVYPRPTIAVLSTGDELVDPETCALGRGQIRDSNRPMLLSAAIQQQCKILDLGIARDNAEELERILDDAISAGVDILLTSGGVSMGDRDLVQPLLQKRGTVYFNRVLMKPGKPLTFADITVKSSEERPAKKILALGLPGNPVSSLVCFHLFAVPAIRHLAGWADPRLQRVHVRIALPIKTDPSRPEFHRAIIRWALNDGSGNPGFIAESTGHQMSSRLLSMKSANSLLELPATGRVIPAGSHISAILISDISGFYTMPTLEAERTNLLQRIIQEGGFAYASMANLAANGDRRAAEAAHEIAWEQLHSGPWHSVLPVWRDAYSMSCLLMASVYYGAGEFQEALRVLDMGLIMGGCFLRNDLDSAISILQRSALMGSKSNKGVCEERCAGDYESRFSGSDSGMVVGECVGSNPFSDSGLSTPVQNSEGSNSVEVLRVLPDRSLCCKRIEKRCSLSLEGFLCDYFLSSSPVIISDHIAHWPAMRKWKDVGYLKKVAGGRTVPVEVGRNYLASEWKQELITFSEFLDRIQSGEGSPVTTYLAQHPLFDQIQELRKDIFIPDYCAFSDGELKSLNAWFGPAGTVTPLHHDPHHNLFAQVVGRKYIRLYPASISEDLYPYQESMLSNSSQVDLDNLDSTKFPAAQNLDFVDCILEEGEMLYIPPKWWHYVRSLSTSFSISFWWSKSPSQQLL